MHGKIYNANEKAYINVHFVVNYSKINFWKDNFIISKMHLQSEILLCHLEINSNIDY